MPLLMRVSPYSIYVAYICILVCTLTTSPTYFYLKDPKLSVPEPRLHAFTIDGSPVHFISSLVWCFALYNYARLNLSCEDCEKLAQFSFINWIHPWVVPLVLFLMLFGVHHNLSQGMYGSFTVFMHLLLGFQFRLTAPTLAADIGKRVKLPVQMLYNLRRGKDQELVAIEWVCVSCHPNIAVP